MSKFAMIADYIISRQVFDFQLAETGSHATKDRHYWIVDTNSDWAVGFSLLDDIDKICDQMNRDQSWGPFEPEKITGYTLI